MYLRTSFDVKFVGYVLSYILKRKCKFLDSKLRRSKFRAKFVPPSSSPLLIF